MRSLIATISIFLALIFTHKTLANDIFLLPDDIYTSFQKLELEDRIMHCGGVGRHALEELTSLLSYPPPQKIKGFNSRMDNAENVMLNFICVEDAPVLPVHDSFIMHYAYGELGELEEKMRKSFHGHFKKDINIKSEIGVLLPSSFEGREWNDLSLEELVHGPLKYSQEEDRN